MNRQLNNMVQEYLKEHAWNPQKAMEKAAKAPGGNLDFNFSGQGEPAKCSNFEAAMPPEEDDTGIFDIGLDSEMEVNEDSHSLQQSGGEGMFDTDLTDPFDGI